MWIQPLRNVHGQWKQTPLLTVFSRLPWYDGLQTGNQRIRDHAICRFRHWSKSCTCVTFRTTSSIYLMSGNQRSSSIAVSATWNVSIFIQRGQDHNEYECKKADQKGYIFNTNIVKHWIPLLMQQIVIHTTKYKPVLFWQAGKTHGHCQCNFAILIFYLVFLCTFHGYWFHVNEYFVGWQ